MTTSAHQYRIWVRAINALVAMTLAAVVLAVYWPTVRVLELHTADLDYRGEWIGDGARRITRVTADGPADRAGLRAGDVLLFDPGRDADWVLAGYREMPEGFTASVPVRHADGTQSMVTLAPAKVAFAPTLNDRLALPARLTGLTLALLIGVLLVWARPCLMTWSFFLSGFGSLPSVVLTRYEAAYSTTAGGALLCVDSGLQAFCLFFLPFALSFPRDTVPGWHRWQRVLGGAAIIAVVTIFALLPAIPFERDHWQRAVIWVPMALLVILVGLGTLVRSYRGAAAGEQAGLKWAILGLSGLLGSQLAGLTFLVGLAQAFPHWRSGNPLTPAHWSVVLGQGLIMPLAMAYAVLRQRLVDVQFALSRSVVYGIVSTIVLVFLAVLHWLLGRVIEHSGLAFGLEGLVAVGLGLVLHRASHGINRLVDRVLFRKHHAAEERLRQVTTALPFATTERSIAAALVEEPARNLDLASAALFYRAAPEGPLERVLAHGWGEDHATRLDAESMLVRYLQAEHDPLRLDDVEWLPAGMPEGIAHPVLAIPIVEQHALTALVLYGGHVNGTLLDPDEIELLSALAKAAATSHQQVRIATLIRDKAAAEREAAIQKARVDQLEASLRLLAQERG